MTENSTIARKHDRLFAFLRTFPLEASPCPTPESANLLIVAADGSDTPTHIVYRPRADGHRTGLTVLASASLSFGGSRNPLVGALPPEIVFDLALEPELSVLSQMLLNELSVSRCGGGFIGRRLSEIVVVHAIRRAIAIGTVNAGLMAGLAHADLHPCLVAMHDDPGYPWTIHTLSEIAGMSRSRFIRTFNQTVGQPPLSYLTQWRLTLGRVNLAEGHTVKVAAGKVGFSSAAGFSRAFSRVFGHSPSTVAALVS